MRWAGPAEEVASTCKETAPALGSAELDGSSAEEGELNRVSGGIGELDGTSGGIGELDGTSGGIDELDGTSGGIGELDGTSGGIGKLDGTSGGIDELDGISGGIFIVAGGGTLFAAGGSRLMIPPHLGFFGWIILSRFESLSCTEEPGTRDEETRNFCKHFHLNHCCELCSSKV